MSVPRGWIIQTKSCFPSSPLPNSYLYLDGSSEFCCFVGKTGKTCSLLIHQGSSKPGLFSCHGLYSLSFYILLCPGETPAIPIKLPHKPLHALPMPLCSWLGFFSSGLIFKVITYVKSSLTTPKTLLGISTKCCPNILAFFLIRVRSDHYSVLSILHWKFSCLFDCVRAQKIHWGVCLGHTFPHGQVLWENSLLRHVPGEGCLPAKILSPRLQ